MATKRWALGTKIQRQNPATTTWEDVPGLGDITGPDETTDWLDLTSHDSPNESEEGVPTVHRHGEIRAPMRYDPADPVHAALLSDLNTKRLGNWRIVMTDVAQHKLSFQGYVLGLSYSFPVAGALQQQFVLRASGAVTLS
jgi:hypothetical protein